MDWYRIKTVLIVLFLAINLFLAALLGYESYSENRANRARTAAAVQTLEKSGIKIEGDVSAAAPRLRALTLENPYADKFAFATRILGGEPTQLGTSFRRNGNTVTFLEKGFSYVGSVPSVSPDKKSIKAMKSSLEAMGFSMRYAKGALSDGAVLFTQKVDKVPLFGCALRVWPGEGGKPARMEGTWANIVDTVGEKQKISIAAEALLAFLQEGTHEGQTVKRAECGYAILLGADGYRTADAVPAWRIETADGAASFYDARQ